MTFIQYDLATQENDLPTILALQKRNLPKMISKEEAKLEGFVTVEHNLSLLQRMNQPFPHIVARAGDQTIAYALVMLRALQHDIPVLVPMFQEIDTILYRGVILRESAYITMGQICIDKAFRGQGVFKGLYEKMKLELHAHFDYIITEISARNSRSLRAHEKVGFQTIKEYEADGEQWVIVLLETK